MKKYLLIIALTSLLGSACMKSATETPANNNSGSASGGGGGTGSANSANQKTETKSSETTSNSKTFLGNINNSRIQINLSRDGNNLSGTYSYVKVGTSLKLSGTISGAGDFTLEETDGAGNKTGEWKGTWKDVDGRATLTGKWKNPKGGAALDFSADEQATSFTGGAKITTKTIKESNKEKHYEITAEYPEISGVDSATAGNFNQITKKIATDSGAGFKENIGDLSPEDLKRFTGDARLYDELTYSVETANDSVISLYFTDSSYTGGAHGNATSTTVNFDIKNNKELKLADLFEPNSNYLKTIADYSLADLKKQLKEGYTPDMADEGASAKEENYKSWNLTKKGLQINFDAYQVASYADGPQTVVIPYAKLQSILRKDGAVASVAK